MNQVTLNRQGRSLAQHATSGLGFSRHPMVSRAGNRFTLIDSAGNERPQVSMDATGRIYMDVVIFDASPHPNRMFFEGVYDPNAGSPPDCFSDNGTGPSQQSRNPQAPTCAICPNARWGSKVTPQGKEVPACQVGKKLAVLVLGDASGLAYEFRVPPGSFSGQPSTDPQEGGWTWYVKALKGHGAELFDVVTRITFVPNTMGQLVFKPISQLDSSMIVRVNDAWDRNLSDELVGLKDTAVDPARIGQKPAPVQNGNVNYPAAQQLPPPPAPPAQPSGAFAGVQYQGGGQPAPQTAAPAQEAPPRKRRTKEQIAADNAAQQGAAPLAAAPVAPFMPQSQVQQPAPFPAQPDPTAIPSFLQRNPAPAQPATVLPPGPQFGLQQPQAMPPDLTAQLDQAFKLPS